MAVLRSLQPRCLRCSETGTVFEFEQNFPSMRCYWIARLLASSQHVCDE
jgi:hypothetical protein